MKIEQNLIGAGNNESLIPSTNKYFESLTVSLTDKGLSGLLRNTTWQMPAFFLIN